MSSVKVIVNGKTTRVEASGKSIEELAKQLKINHETVIIKKNGEIAHPDEKIEKGDEVEFVGIIYGG